MKRLDCVRLVIDTRGTCPPTQGSKRVRGRAVVDAHQKQLELWRWILAKEVRRVHVGPPAAKPMAVALAVELTFPRPKGHFGTGRRAGRLKPSAPERPIVKPDLLKVVRGVEDALTGIVYADDSQIVAHDLDKTYHPDPCPDHRTAIEVTIFDNRLSTNFRKESP
jgi:Holliday junction resolvase RusA-like endonuclease